MKHIHNEGVRMSNCSTALLERVVRVGDAMAIAVELHVKVSDSVWGM